MSILWKGGRYALCPKILLVLHVLMITLCLKGLNYYLNPKITLIRLDPKRTLSSVLCITIDHTKPVTFIFDNTNITLHLHMNYILKVTKIISIKMIVFRNPYIMQNKRGKVYSYVANIIKVLSIQGFTQVCSFYMYIINIFIDRVQPKMSPLFLLSVIWKK